MKTRKSVATVVVFALIAMIARSQIVFAQATPTPIKGSWDAVKAVPPGEKVAVRLRNGKTLKGWMISASDTVLTLERKKNNTDVNRGDVLRVHRMVKRSGEKEVLLGFLIGAGVGAVLGVLAEPDYSDDPGLTTLILGLLGAAVGTSMGAAIGILPQRMLIYETK
jgi:hypothetical protein